MRSSGSRYVPQPPAEGDRVSPAGDKGAKVAEGDRVTGKEERSLGVDGLVGAECLGDRSSPWTL